MICPYCGTNNEESSKFCKNCGKELSSANTSGPTPPSSYHQLGGWLAVLTYGMLIGVVLIMIGAVMGGITLVRYARYLGMGLLLLGLLDIALYIPVVYCCLKMYQMIKSRDCRFLRFYELTMLILGGVDLALMVIGAGSGYLSSGDHFTSFLEAMIVFAIWMTYFTKSVRVRTYFGSDEYLKQSIVLNALKKYKT